MSSSAAGSFFGWIRMILSIQINCLHKVSIYFPNKLDAWQKEEIHNIQPVGALTILRKRNLVYCNEINEAVMWPDIYQFIHFCILIIQCHFSVIAFSMAHCPGEEKGCIIYPNVDVCMFKRWFCSPSQSHIAVEIPFVQDPWTLAWHRIGKCISVHLKPSIFLSNKIKWSNLRFGQYDPPK